MRHIASLPLALLCLASGAWSAQFPGIPTLPSPQIPSNVPSVPGVGQQQQQQQSPAASAPKTTAYIYEYYNDPGDIALNFAKLSEEQCTRILAKARVLIPDEQAYREKTSDHVRMVGSVSSLKGFILEELYFTSENYQDLLAKSQQAAEAEGIPADNVVLIRNAYGRMPIAGSGSMSGWNELTDGMIAAVLERPAPGDADAMAAFDNRIAQYAAHGVTPGHDRYLRIIAVIESKTPKENVKLAQGEKGTSGQFEKDYGRLSTMPVMIDDREFAPGQVIVSRTGTSWTAVLPRDYRTEFRQAAFTGVFTRFDKKMEEFNFILHEGPVSNHSAELIAANVFGILYEKQLFGHIQPLTPTP